MNPKLSGEVEAEAMRAQAWARAVRLIAVPMIVVSLGWLLKVLGLVVAGTSAFLLVLLGLGIGLAMLLEGFGGRSAGKPWRGYGVAGAAKRLQMARTDGAWGGRVPGSWVIAVALAALAVAVVWAGLAVRSAMLVQTMEPGQAAAGVTLTADELRGLLETAQHGGGISGWWWVLALAGLGVAAVVLLRSAQKHPATLPVVAVVPLATAAIAQADHLSKYGGWSFWVIAGVLLAVGLGCAGWAGWVGVGKTDRKGTSGEEKQLVSLMTMSFSMFVLLWTFVLVGGRSESEVCGPAKLPAQAAATICPKCPAMSVGEAVLLKDRPYFDSGKSDPQNPGGGKELAAAWAGKAAPGDLILLLGSTDCMRFKGGNASLAKARADAVEKVMTTELPGVNVRQVILNQHDLCTKAQEMRTVFPIVVKAQQR